MVDLFVEQLFFLGYTTISRKERSSNEKVDNGYVYAA